MRYFDLHLASRMRAALIGGAVAVLMATASVAAPAMAADQPTTTAATPEAAPCTVRTEHCIIGLHTHQIHGTVKGTPAAGATSFVVTTERYGDVTVTFPGAKVRGHGHAAGHARSFEVSSVAALKDGDRVVVQGRTSADGKTFVARRVHLLPAEGAAAHPMHVVGTIATVSTTTNGNTTLTITPTNGSTPESVTVTSDTKIHPDGKSVADLKPGVKVTVVSKNGTATGVVVMAS
jgi:hypothetical protein